MNADIIPEVTYNIFWEAFRISTVVKWPHK